MKRATFDLGLMKHACLKGFCFNIISDDITFENCFELQGSVVLIRTTLMILIVWQCRFKINLISLFLLTVTTNISRH